MNTSKITVKYVEDFFASLNAQGTFENTQDAIYLKKQGHQYFLAIKGKVHLHLGSTVKELQNLFKFAGMESVWKFLEENMEIIKDVKTQPKEESLSQEDYDLFYTKIDNMEFERNGKTYSIGYDYSDWGHMVIFNETDDKLVKRIKDDEDLIEKLPKYVAVAIKNEVDNFLSNEDMNVDYVSDLLSEKLLLKGISVNFSIYTRLREELLLALAYDRSVRLELVNLIEGLPHPDDQDRHASLFAPDSPEDFEKFDRHYADYLSLRLRLFLDCTVVGYSGTRREINKQKQQHKENRLLAIKQLSRLKLLCLKNIKSIQEVQSQDYMYNLLALNNLQNDESFHWDFMLDRLNEFSENFVNH